MSAEETEWGGYSYEFVNAPPDRLVCKICYLPSRIPHLTKCCGSIVCRSCSLVRSTTVGSVPVSCTSCGRENFGATYNKNLEDEIKRLYIFCVNKTKGCQWRGELNDIESRRHFEKGCPESNCSNPNEIIQQQNHHLMTIRAKFCKLESKLSATKTKAEYEVAEVSEQARIINEKIVAIEQTVDTVQGKFYAEFYKIQEAQHNTLPFLLKNFIRKSQLDQWVSHLHLSVSGNKICPVILKIYEVEDKKIHSKEWRSDPFYTHDKGYRMCLLVIFNGTNHVNATYVSVFLYLMKGPYDDDLKWPLIRNFEIALLNQKKDEEHHIDEISFTSDTPKTLSGKIKAKQHNEIAHGGLGRERYIAYNDLKKITYTRQYVKDDCMYMKIC